MGVFAVGLGIMIISQATLLATIVNEVFVKGTSLLSIAALLGTMLAVIIARTVLSYGIGRTGIMLAAVSKSNIRDALIRNMTKNPLLTALGGQTGGKVSVLLDAVDEIDSYFSQYVPRLMEASFIPLLLLIAVFFQHPASGFIMLASAPFIPIFMILVGLQTQKKSEEKYTQLTEFSGTFLDSLQGLLTLKLFGRVNRQQQEIERSSLGFRDATIGILRIAFTNTLMLELIVMLSIGLIALELALQLLVFKSMSFDTAFLVLLLAPEFYSLLKNTGTAFHSGRTSMGAARKVEQALGDLMESGHEETCEEKDSNRSVMHQMPPAIEVNQLQFSFGDNKFELAVDTVHIRPGEKIAIVGPSGAGKTTFMHILAGLIRPLSGEVQVNNRVLSPAWEESWFEQMSYITQHPYIFAGSLRDNIMMGTRRQVSQAEIEGAAEAAGLSSLINGLEEGYDTLVGEGGRGLSGGEKQRLALARAFLNRPAVIMFDEPTVGLDLYTERVLQRSIEKLSIDATLITVAHRLYTIRQADCILFMEKGTLVDSGSHDDLMKRLPQYAEMVDVQRRGGFQ